MGQKPAQGLALPPQFAPLGSVYTNNVRVRLTSATAGAVIRYTVDGSEPTDRSPVFSQSVSITNSALLKARVFVPDSAPSPTVSQTYTLLDETVANFSSNLPLVILNTFGGYVSRESKTPISATVINPSGGRCSLTGHADFNGRGTLHFRGRSSLEYRKNS